LLLASALVQVVVLNEVSTTYISLDVLRWTLYRTPVGTLENAVLCCVLFTKPYLDGGVLLRVCVAMGMFCIATNTCTLVADRLPMLESHGILPHVVYTLLNVLVQIANKMLLQKEYCCVTRTSRKYRSSFLQLL
jgi:hypothetical protein